MIGNIDYHIIDKCNLNCASCNHFSSLVPSSDKGKSIEQITADLTLLSKIKNEFDTLTLLGGEPTLHPQLSKILRIAREILPKNHINLVTNGTTYNKILQWKDALIESNVEVTVSLYPYCNDYIERTKKIIDTLSPEVKVYTEGNPIECGFGYGFFSNRNNVASEYEIMNCMRRFYCPQLKNGKLYLCHFLAQFNRLKDYFGDEIKFDLDGKEYLNLNGEVTAKDFYDFIYGAYPDACNHCVECHDHQDKKQTRPWAITKKNINEWLID